ncbi:MAG: hypothetical protein AAFQ58_22865 [Pseudomonadota bacterium]
MSFLAGESGGWMTGQHMLANGGATM